MLGNKIRLVKQRYKKHFLHSHVVMDEMINRTLLILLLCVFLIDFKVTSEFFEINNTSVNLQYGCRLLFIMPAKFNNFNNIYHLVRLFWAFFN